jgi:hypothetical protein
VRRWRLLLYLLALSACQDGAGSMSDAVSGLDSAVPSAIRLKAVLVAGDDELPVFDNASRYLDDRLIAAGFPAADIHRLSAAAHSRDGVAEATSLASIADRIGGLKPSAGEGCLVFLSSHGDPRKGFVLARSREYLTPARLDRMLSSGCASAPTIVVVSACYSGGFAVSPMTRPNRIVLTAARSDRPSFGCGAGFTYNTFDQCFLGALDGAETWRDIAVRTKGCVATREAAMKQTPSQPQAYLGAAVLDMPAPWRALGGDPGAVRFTAGPGRFSPGAVPLPASDRTRHAKMLEQYDRAAAPKAFAMSPDGAFSWSDRSASGAHAEADVQRMALQVCEWYGVACVLYAVDDAVVAPLPSGLPPFHPPMLVRAGPLDPASVPFIRDDQRPLIAEYIARPSPKALALGVQLPVIEYASAATIGAARDQAMHRCLAAATECVVYAEDQTVVLGYRTR